MAIVFGMQAGFLESAGLEETLNAVTGRHHTFFAAGIQFVLTPASARGSALIFEFLQQHFLYHKSEGQAYAGLGMQNSVSTPKVDLGLRKATSLPPAPSKGFSLISFTPESEA